MNNLYSRRLGALMAALSALMLSLPSGFAQDTGEEVFELSPFSVDTSGDQGWRATNTLTGSRTNQELKNVPLSVDALTTDFMEDLGIQTLEEASLYIAGVDVVPDDETRNDANPSFRGLATGGRENAAASRNNFLWYPRTDNYNVERIDFNKGSNSLMFGDASPGGLATVYTKRARFNDFGSVTAKYGSHDTYRIMLDVNRKITDKLALRVNAVDKNDRSYIDWGDDFLKAMDLAATFKATENTIFRFEVEDMRFERGRANSNLAVRQEAAEGLALTGSNVYYTSDGDIYNGRSNSLINERLPRRVIWRPDGNGGYLDPEPVASSDRRNGARGDQLMLHEGAVQQVYSYASRDYGDPFITLGPVTPAVNVWGPRSFIERDINNYTFIAEQTFGDLFVELGLNKQEQFQFRNDNDFSTGIGVDGNGRLYNDSNLDRKWFGNDVNTVRLSASYPLQIGENISHFFVGNVTYQDDEAYSYRQRLVNKAGAYVAETGTYDTKTDLEGLQRIRVRSYYDGGLGDLRDENLYDGLRPENLPLVPGIFEPMWVDYTTANKPYTDKRYAKSASLSTNGTYFGGRLRSLLGIRKDETTVKRYLLPGGSLSDRVDQFGEIAYWGADVFVGSPDDAPEFYAHVPELDQSATTYSAGLVYQVNDSINVYANNSTSFRWQGTEDFLGRIIGSQEGETREIGFKGTLMENRFAITGAVFEIDRGNVAYRVSNANNQGTIERLFNDSVITIEEDGTLIYEDPDPAITPNYQVTGMGLNQEYRQITADELSTGWEINLQMNRTAGLQARFAISHTEVDSKVDLAEYEEQVRLAEARVPVRQAFLDANWPNDPAYDPENPDILPGAEQSLRLALSRAQQVLVDNAPGSTKIVGSRGRPYQASWVLDYQFGENFVLPEMRMILTGRYADNYLLSTNDAVDWYGGSTHGLNLALNWKTQINEYPVTFLFRINDLYDFENDEIKEFNGFIDEKTDALTWRYRNVRPTSYDLTAIVKF